MTLLDSCIDKTWVNRCDCELYLIADLVIVLDNQAILKRSGILCIDFCVLACDVEAAAYFEVVKAILGLGKPKNVTF